MSIFRSIISVLQHIALAQYHAHSGSSSPVSPGPPPIYSPHHHQPFLPHQQNNLEEKFQKFRLDCQPQFQDSGGNYLTQNPGTPTTGIITR